MIDEFLICETTNLQVTRKNILLAYWIVCEKLYLPVMNLAKVSYVIYIDNFVNHLLLFCEHAILKPHKYMALCQAQIY